MLVHLCTECEKVSLNRIAADDIAENLLEVFQNSLQPDQHTQAALQRAQVEVLKVGEKELVYTRLFGLGSYAPLKTATFARETALADW